MSNYTQLTQEQRYQIYGLMKAGLYQTQIARIVGVHKSTTSREMRANRGFRRYHPKQAHHLAQIRWVKSVRIRISPPTWSPEQISGWLDSEHQITVSHESIDQFILTDKQGDGNFTYHLRGQKQPRKRYASTTHPGQLVDRVPIWPASCHC